MTKTVLAISPHLDDAAFSCGGTLAQRARAGCRVVIATCFTANVARPDGFALACQLDKGLDATVDYMALRRREDEIACAALGATAIHLPFLEAPHRGYHSAADLFAGRRADDAIQTELDPALVELIDKLQPDLVLGPIGIGRHVDHLVVATALASMNLGSQLHRWEDWPYADRQEHDQLMGHDPIVVPLAKADIDAKINACGAYQSQIGFQFGSADRMSSRIRKRSTERFLV